MFYVSRLSFLLHESPASLQNFVALLVRKTFKRMGTPAGLGVSQTLTVGGRRLHPQNAPLGRLGRAETPKAAPATMSQMVVLSGLIFEKKGEETELPPLRYRSNDSAEKGRVIF